MRKLMCVLAIVLSGMMAQAGDFAYLVFTNTNGTVTVMSVDRMTMTVDGEELQVANEAETVRFALTGLASMQFSNDPSAIDNVLDADAPVQVYSISGMSLGEYNSLVEAAKSLGTGAYVVSNGSVTQTIVIR